MDPNVQTDPSGKAKLSFYTSDQEGSYQIRVHGISGSGYAGSAGQVIVVKK